MSARRTATKLATAMGRARFHQRRAKRAEAEGNQHKVLDHTRWASFWTRRAIELTQQLEKEMKDSRDRQSRESNRPGRAEGEEE